MSSDEVFPIARAFAFVILSTAKDLTNHSAYGVIHHSELEHSPSLSFSAASATLVFLCRLVTFK
jgi:hypothetical protein